jgi:ABC-type multidrug transport system ATPase subunit
VQAAIEARAVSCRTRAGEVTLRDISLTIGHGELVAIIGSSGSGKTTLLDAMSGLRPPTSGTVLRPAGGDGRPASESPARDIGYIPNEATVHPVLPLARALRYTAALRGVPGYREAVADALDQVGLAAAAAVAVGSLNPGERKRAAVAAELLARPAQLFLDEPTAGLDPAQAAEVLRLLRRLSDGGMTVVLTTSSPLDAARCDKVAVLAAGGHLAFFGTPAAASGYFGADSLEEVYERLAGLGDPAAAWSRRFFQFSITRAGSTPVPATPRAPGPAVLVPDLAGPHSAGPVSIAVDDDEASDAARGGRPDPPQNPPPGASPGNPARQWAVLTERNAEVLARARRLQAVLVSVPAVVVLAFCVLLGSGALDGVAAVTLAWVVLGGLVTGLAYELPVRGSESAGLRRKRFPGLSPAVIAAANATVLLPLLAAADALILAVPGIAGRLQDGFGPAYLTAACASLIGLACARAVRAVTTRW